MGNLVENSAFICLTITKSVYFVMCCWRHSNEFIQLCKGKWITSFGLIFLNGLSLNVDIADSLVYSPPICEASNLCFSIIPKDQIVPCPLCITKAHSVLCLVWTIVCGFKFIVVFHIAFTITRKIASEKSRKMEAYQWILVPLNVLWKV